MRAQEFVLDEACWAGYRKDGMKTMFGKRYPNCVKKKKTSESLDQQGVAEGSQQISEYRDRLLQYVKSLLPNYPEYVLKDWLVPNKGDFSNLPDTELKNGIMEKLKGAGLTPNTKWQLIPDMKFTMDMFDPKTKQLLVGRAGGSSDLGMGIPRDKERHATQAALAQQQGGVRKEPVLLIKTDKGYELLEGWHRTIQHFAKYPDGYTGPAYVAVAQPGVAEGARVARKAGQPAGSKKHSDLYTDENPRGTITGLKFATAEDARASVTKIRSSGRSHAHKIQAAVAMEQRARAAGKAEAAAVYRRYINANKKSAAVAGSTK